MNLEEVFLPSYGIKLFQVLYKRKPVQYVSRPAFISDDSEASMVSLRSAETY